MLHGVKLSESNEPLQQQIDCERIDVNTDTETPADWTGAK